MDKDREIEQKQYEDLRLLVETTMREVAVMQNILHHLELSLFGGEGREGIIDRVEHKLAAHDKWIYIATGAIVAMQFLSGSGILSLKGLIGH